MDSILLYVLLFGGLFAVLLVRRLVLLLAYHLVPRLRVVFARHVQYPLVVERRYWASITRLQASVMFIYFLINALALGVSIRSSVDLQRRAAMAAVINLTSTFLGGRTNPLADIIGIPISTYYLAHHWIGRVAIVEALLHSSIILIRRLPTGGMEVSGYIAVGTLLAILLTSVWIARRFFGKLFITIHRVLALTGLVGLFWHVLLQPSAVPKIPVFVSCGLWLLTRLYRSARIIYSWKGAASVTDKWCDAEVTRIRVETPRPISFIPGSYFYIFFPGTLYPYRTTALPSPPITAYNLASSFPMTAMFCEPDKLSSSGRIRDLAFLISNRGHQARHVMHLEKGQHVLLDGPYGKDLKLHRFETVVLTAKGVGIIGVLPFALNLAERRRSDDQLKRSSSKLQSTAVPLFRDTTRKVDLFWMLERNSQERWVSDELIKLQGLDPGNKLLAVWCFYPSPRVGEEDKPPFNVGDHWKCKYPKSGREASDMISREILQEARSPGKSVVVACGDPPFTAEVRKAVVRNTEKDRIIDFREVEFRPPRTEFDVEHLGSWGSGYEPSALSEKGKASILSEKGGSLVLPERVEPSVLSEKGGSLVLSKKVEPSALSEKG